MNAFDDPGLSARLNKCAEQGWRLVGTVSNTLILERDGHVRRLRPGHLKVGEVNLINEEIGTRYFEEVIEVRLVEIVSQRDEPPGRGDRKPQCTTLYKSVRRLQPQAVENAIRSLGSNS